MRDYYNRNTRRFLRFGHGSRIQAIHRAVWAPGVRDRDSALAYVNRFVARQLHAVGRATGATSVLDLGCGVGGTLFALAGEESPGPTGVPSLEGVTISSVQAEVGRNLARSAARPISIVEGDYASDAFWEARPGPYGLVYAIESLVHVGNCDFVLRRIAERLASGGRFVLIDDMYSRETAGRSATDVRVADEFRRGWHADGLVQIDDMVGRARSAGMMLLEAHTLTPWLELGRPRDVLVSLSAWVFRRIGIRGAWYDSLLGGAALQRLLRGGALGYYALVFGPASARGR